MYDKKDKILLQHAVIFAASLFALFAFGAATSFQDWSADPALAAFLGFNGLNVLVAGFRYLNA